MNRSQQHVVSQIKRIIRNEAASLIPKDDFLVNRLRAREAEEGDLLVNQGGIATWLNLSSVADDYYVNITGDEMTGPLDSINSDTGTYPGARLRTGTGAGGLLQLGSGVAPLMTMPPGGATTDWYITWLSTNRASALPIEVSTAPTTANELCNRTYVDLHIAKSLLTTRGDLIRRGASAPERVALGSTGMVLTSNGTDAVWSRDGQMVESGYVAATANSAGAGDKLTLGPLTGDNVNRMEIDFMCHANSDGAAGTTLQILVRDGAGGTGTVYNRAVASLPNVGYCCNLKGTAIIPAFSGTKTFYLNLQNSAGTPTAQEGSFGASRHMRARWMAP